MGDRWSVGADERDQPPAIAEQMEQRGGLGAKVTALEGDQALAAKARANLAKAGAANVSVDEGPFDGTTLPPHAFDVVIIEGTLESEPTGLFRLLGDGGRLVALVGSGGAAVAHVFVRSGDDVAGRSEFNTTLPPLAAVPREDTFVF